VPPNRDKTRSGRDEDAATQISNDRRGAPQAGGAGNRTR
jgi:hypothetical protein